MYASPGMFKVVSKKKALHIEDYNPSKALPKGTTCHILKLFYKAEVEHGRGSYIDPILRKGYKTLPGLTYVV
jgi:hypothetical protein